MAAEDGTVRGFLYKRSDWMRKWDRRFFVLDGGVLNYYQDNQDYPKPKGTFPMPPGSRSAVATTTHAHGFAVSVGGKVVVNLAAENAKDMSRWIDAFNGGKEKKKDTGGSSDATAAAAAAAVTGGAATPPAAPAPGAGGADQKTHTVIFGDGPLGMKLGVADGQLKKLGTTKVQAVGKTATAKGVRTGNVVQYLNGVAVAQTPYLDILKMIKESERPLTMTCTKDEDGADAKAGADEDGAGEGDDASTTAVEELPSAEAHAAWMAKQKTYEVTCAVQDPEKSQVNLQEQVKTMASARKLSGLSGVAHVTYRITTTNLMDKSESWSVRRRFSDFVWLRNLLHKRYAGMLIPPLPQKRRRMSVEAMREMGKTNEHQHVLNRMRMLTLFVGRVVQHPYLKSDATFAAFTSVQDGDDWLAAKKAASGPGGKSRNDAYLHWVAAAARFTPKEADKAGRHIQDFGAQVNAQSRALEGLIRACEKLLDSSAIVRGKLVEVNNGVDSTAAAEAANADPTKNEMADTMAPETHAVLEKTQELLQKSVDSQEREGPHIEIMLLQQLQYLQMELQALRDMLKAKTQAVGQLGRPARKLITAESEHNAAISAGLASAERIAKLVAMVYKLRSECKRIEYTDAQTSNGLLMFTLADFRARKKQIWFAALSQFAASMSKIDEARAGACDVTVKLVGLKQPPLAKQALLTLEQADTALKCKAGEAFVSRINELLVKKGGAGTKNEGAGNNNNQDGQQDGTTAEAAK